MEIRKFYLEMDWVFGHRGLAPAYANSDRDSHRVPYLSKALTNAEHVSENQLVKWFKAELLNFEILFFLLDPES